MQLGELLLVSGLVTSADIEAGLARQEKLGGRIGENLIALGIITKKTLDEALHEQYELAKAILDSEDLLAKAKRILGSSHPKTNRLRRRLAVALIAGGRAEEALSIAQAALAGHKDVLGGDHPWTKDSAQAVADAAAVIERAASSGEGSAPAARREAGEQLDANIVNGDDTVRLVENAKFVDRATLVAEVTTRFVGKPAPARQHVGPIRRMTGILPRHR